MKINEILSKFSFHDSCINELIYHNNKVIMMIDFLDCGKIESFNLKNIYNKNKFIKAILEFENVNDFKFESYDGYKKFLYEIDYHEIIKVCISKENIIEFFLDQESIIKIKCESINFYLRFD